MAETEKKYDITGKSVQLPGGGTFDFHWRLGGIEGGEALAEAGMGLPMFNSKIREICDMAQMLGLGNRIPNGSVDFAITHAMHLYRRLDGFLHMFAVTQPEGPALIERALASVADWDDKLNQASDATYRAIEEAREKIAAEQAEKQAEGADATTTEDAGEEG